MLLSTAAYAIKDNGTTSTSSIVKYKGNQFVKNTAGSWSFLYSGNNQNTLFNPMETNDTNINIRTTVADYKDQIVYYVGLQDNSYYDIKNNLLPYTLRMPNACLDSNCTQDFPTVTCDQKVINVREPNEGEKERIYQEANCVYIVASYNNQTRYADSFIFQVFGMN